MMARPPAPPTRLSLRGERANQPRTVLAARPQQLSEARPITMETTLSSSIWTGTCPAARFTNCGSTAANKITAFAVASFVLIVIPGPGVLFVIGRALAHGRGTALIPTIGASGAIYGVLLAVAVIMPHRQVWVFPLPVTVSMRVFVIVMGAIEFFSTIGATGDGVSHVCHLGGMLVGYIYLRRGSYGYSVRNYFSDWKKQRLKKKFEVYVRDHQDKPPSNPDNWVN